MVMTDVSHDMLCLPPLNTCTTLRPVQCTVNNAVCTHAEGHYGPGGSIVQQRSSAPAR
jgi:hypothetical protein